MTRRFCMRLHPAMKSSERKVIPFRTATMSTQIVAQVRDALFAKELRPGDFLGTEKELAERFAVSRIVARDALRTLEAQGVVEIKVGSGGGARIAQGNARLFAEALAVQLDLAGVSVSEIMDAQRAIECRAAELAAVNSTAEDHARLRELIAQAERRINDVAGFTRASREFHLAVAEASHNRVLVVQLISLQHVSWPAPNPTLTPSVARRVLDAHKEWVAEEKGYFKDEGLDYDFQELIKSTDGAHHYKGDKVGAMQSFERGRTSNVSCACHWTVGVAASKGNGRLYAGVYSVAPSGVFVPQDSPVRKPEDLAGVPIAVGYQSGSHYSTIQALEQFMPADKINLTFADGMLFHRLDQLIDGKAQASALFSGPYYFAEQLGFRKVIDTTFMITAMVVGDPDPEDLRKFFRALRRAQRDIDLRPDRYTHYYRQEFPLRYHAMMDTRRWGPGERIVFEPYTREVFDETFRWIADHGIFADAGMGSGRYEDAVVALT